jgi:hypothetical protein
VEWRDIVYNMLVAAGCYLSWKSLSLLVGREQKSARKLLRYLWPSAMVVWGWAMLWATSFPASSFWMGKSLDVLLVLFFTLNFPAAILGNAVLSILIDWPGPAKGIAASLVVWLLWYGMIRGWERWKARQTAASLVPRITP